MKRFRLAMAATLVGLGFVSGCASSSCCERPSLLSRLRAPRARDGCCDLCGNGGGCGPCEAGGCGAPLVEGPILEAPPPVATQPTLPAPLPGGPPAAGPVPPLAPVPAPAPQPPLAQPTPAGPASRAK
jgi:hypothetical protein